MYLAFDFPLHSHDSRAHFWPITDWKYFSPVSYWEGPSGRIVGWVELILTFVLAAILLVRHADRRARAGIGALVVAQLAPFVMWSFVFS